MTCFEIVVAVLPGGGLDPAFEVTLELLALAELFPDWGNTDDVVCFEVKLTTPLNG